MAPLQLLLENGLRQTMSALLGGTVSELAWERAKLTTCWRGPGYQGSPVGICSAGHVLVGRRLAQGRHAQHLNRPLLQRQPDVAFALAAKADLLTAGVAVDDHAMKSL